MNLRNGWGYKTLNDEFEEHDLKPSDFFIGVVDFFAVILPGALITFFLKGAFYTRAFGEGKLFPRPESELQGWIVFLLITYVAGNLIFVIGSLLLDKLIYDKFLREILFKKNFDLSYKTATSVRDEYLSTDLWLDRLIAENRLERDQIEQIYKKKKREILNTFKWGQRYLALKHPEALVEIKKYEADSKFFRSLVIAFIIIAAVLLAQGRVAGGLLFLAFTLASLYRYGDLRYKSTEFTYETIITLKQRRRCRELEIAPPPVRDTRQRFLAARETHAAYATRIGALTRGLRSSSDFLSIPPGENWEVTDSAGEAIFCLRGKCMLKSRTAGSPEQTALMSTDAMASVPANSSFQIHNYQPDSLLLLALR
jgi:hypothetical protein